MNSKWKASLLAAAMGVLLSACGGGSDAGSADSSSGSGSSSGGGSSGGGGTSGGGSSGSFAYSKYEVFGLYGTGANSGSGAVTSQSSTQAVLALGVAFVYNNTSSPTDATITLASDSLSLSSSTAATGLSWLAPGANGSLMQICVKVPSSSGSGTYAKSMHVAVGSGATALTQIASIPAGTVLFSAEDCAFTSSSGKAPSDIASLTTQNTDHAVVNADGSLTLKPVGGSSLTVSAANVAAALASGGTGLDGSGDVARPSTTGTATGSYALHAYSIPRSSGSPRYALVVQATPAGGNRASDSKGFVAMFVSQ